MKLLLSSMLVLFIASNASADPISRSGGSHELVPITPKMEKSEIAKDKTARARLMEKSETEKAEKKIKPVMSRTGGGATGLMMIED